MVFDLAVVTFVVFAPRAVGTGEVPISTFTLVLGPAFRVSLLNIFATRSGFYTFAK